MIGATVFKVLEPCYYFKMGDKFYHVVSRDFLIYDKTFSSVAAGGTSDKTEVTELKPDKDEIYVFAIGVFQKGINVHIYQPAAVARWGVKGNPVGNLTYEVSPAEDPNPATMVATIYERSITVEFENNNTVAVTPKLRFIGFKYKVEEVTDPAKKRELEAKFRDGKLPEILIEY